MTKFKKNLSDEEYLTMLKLVDEDELALAMWSVSGFAIQETKRFVDNLQDDIPLLLAHQCNLDEPITNYKYIKTGIYGKQITVSDSVFDLFSESGWLCYKDNLLKWFNSED